jgi:hypothetical protein
MRHIMLGIRLGLWIMLGKASSFMFFFTFIFHKLHVLVSFPGLNPFHGG